MATATESKGRVYQRKFDYDEAARRHKDGETIRSIARDLGVSEAAVKRAVDPATRARMDNHSSAYSRKHSRKYNYDTCECGREKTKTSAKCRECYLCDTASCTPVREDGHIICLRCGEYKPADEFTIDLVGGSPRRAMRRAECRSCSTAERRRSRQRVMVPCKGGCGKLVHAKSESKNEEKWTGLCIQCWHDTQRKP